MNRTQRLAGVLLALCLTLSLMSAPVLAAGASTMTDSDWDAYNKMTALKEEYPEGMHWTNDNFYGWSAGIYAGGYGCAGFAFLMSDAAFGTEPEATLLENGIFRYEDVRAGTILRVNGDTHSVIVLQTYTDSVEIAEGNYNDSIHWGRVLTKDEVMQSDYIINRAVSTPQSYTVFFDANGGTVSPSSAAVTEGEKYGELPVPVREGYTFDGWFTAAEGGTEITSDSTAELSGDQWLFAHWTENRPANLFTDVPSDAYYAGAVNWAVENGITNGTSENAFSPNASCTRAQMVTFLWRAMGSPQVSGSNPFTDVAPGDYFYDAVLWARSSGITTGVDDSRFDPNGTCSRAQAVTFIWRANNKPGSTMNVPFSDVAPDSYYTEAAAWAAETGITTGTGDGAFSPDAFCSRGAIVTFLYRNAQS